jgi:hypothetical protein
VVVVVVLVVQLDGFGAQRGLRYDSKRRSSSFKKKYKGEVLPHETLYTCFYSTHPNHFSIRKELTSVVVVVLVIQGRCFKSSARAVLPSDTL